MTLYNHLKVCPVISKFIQVLDCQTQLLKLTRKYRTEAQGKKQSIFIKSENKAANEEYESQRHCLLLKQGSVLPLPLYSCMEFSQ
ncbi:60S ribosomal protein L7a [Cricetulus griseus]|nr:60S ribosomal protein L7a [Cricetulus griseus]